MKNKILGILILMAICLMSVSVAQAGCSEGICCDKDLWAKLSENEVHLAHANNIEYEMEVLVISETSNEAKFKINGEITDALSEGEEDTLADGSVIEVKKIITDESPSKVIICFDYGILHCDGMIGELNNGETENYMVGAYEYEVEASVYKGNFRLQVNGELTDWLGIGSEQTMADGLKVKILNIVSDRITFCMTPGPARSTPEQSQPEDKIDLSNYPELFIKGRNLNGNFVVGDQAPADDVIAAIDISVSFQKYGVEKTGGAMLASEVGDYNKNLISVGRPCDNAVTAQILRSNGINNYDSDCSYGLKPGQAIVYLFNYHGYAHMLVFGYSRLETRKAARQLTFQRMKGRKQLLGFGNTMPQLEEPELEEPEPETMEEETREIPECQKEVEQFKKALAEKYENKGLQIPENFLRKYEEMHKSCFGDREQREPPVIENKDEDCPGCRKNEACMQIGIRFLEGDSPVYCDIDHAFKPQKQNGEICMNNYECLSNTCQDGTCQSMKSRGR